MSLTKVTYSMIQSAAADVSNFGTDATAVTAALATLSSGGTLFFPKGTYTLATEVAVTTSNIKILGEPGTIIQITGSNVHNAFQFAGVDNIVVSGITFYWAGADLTSATADYNDLFALRFRSTGTSSVPVTPCTNILVEGCTASQMLLIVSGWDAYPQASMTYALQNKWVVVSKNKVSCTLDSSAIYGGVAAIACFFTSYSKIVENSLSDKDADGNQVSTNSIGGIHFKGGNNGNWVYFNSTNNIVANNQLNIYGYGIYFAAARYNLVQGNVLNYLNSEAIDFEGCRDCLADSNVMNQCKYALAIFYYSANITFSNNTISIPNVTNGGAYGFNQSLSGSTDPTLQGNIYFIANRFVGASIDSGGADSLPIIQFAMVNHLQFLGNYVEDCAVVFAGTVSFGEYRSNRFYWSQNYTWGNGVTSQFGPGGPDNATSTYANPTIDITDNEFYFYAPKSNNLATSSAIIVYNASTYMSTIRVERNHFTNFAYPITHQLVGSSDTNGQCTIKDNVCDINYAATTLTSFCATSGGPANVKSLYFENNTTGLGVDIFGTTAGFTAQRIGAARGSILRNSAPTASGVYAYINVATDGTTSWKSIALSA